MLGNALGLSMQLYVLIGNTGLFESYKEWVVGIYSTKKLAQDKKKKCQEEAEDIWDKACAEGGPKQSDCIVRAREIIDSLPNRQDKKIYIDYGGVGYTILEPITLDQ